MSKPTTKINNKLNNINNKLNSVNKKLKRKTFRKRNTRPRMRRRKFIPAANLKNMNRDFKILYQDGTTVKVTGRDLVYQIPSDLTDQEGTGVITVIPANPCYWLGTRIAALAQGYQNYRPLDMKFTYIPQCAVTQQGNVIAGTLWNQAPSSVNLQQSLRTSNGGMLSQCYKGFTSTVRLKSNLQYNLYKTAGTFDQESNPFIYMAIAIACNNTSGTPIIPGYFYVTWSYLLKNPIGNTNIFYNSGLTTYDQIDDDDHENKTAIYLTPDDDEIPLGAILQLDKDDTGDIVATYNGSVYDMADDDVVWYFANSTIQQLNSLKSPEKGKIYYQAEKDGDGSRINTFCYIRENILDPDEWQITIYNSQHPLMLTHNVHYYYCTDPVQNLPKFNMMYVGTFVFFTLDDQMEPDGMVFYAKKSLVNLELYPNPNIKQLDNKVKKSKRRLKVSNSTVNIQTKKQEIEEMAKKMQINQNDKRPKSKSKSKSKDKKLIPLELIREEEEVPIPVKIETLAHQHSKERAQTPMKTYTNSNPELDCFDY